MLEKKQKTQNEPFPVWKKFAFSSLILLFFFGVLELILLICGVQPYLFTEDPFVGFSANIPLFVESTRPDGAVILTTAENKRKTFNVQNFPKEKAPGVYRIFCMGGSTTYGRPYDDSVSFCGWLREFLKVADPSRKWEVINAGGISYASYRVATLMEELARYQPDLFIVYSGHNEFLERRTYRDIVRVPNIFIRIGALLSRTRIYTAMKLWIVDPIIIKQLDIKKERFELAADVNEILNRTIGPTSYTRDDQLQSQIISHYQFNLERMIRIARQVNSEILFVTPASNLKDMSPFKSENRAVLSDLELKRWNSLYQHGSVLLDGGDFVESLRVFQEALAVDDRYAELHYRVGQAFFSLKRFEEAKIAFQKALDEDILPLRILSPMLKAYRDVAKENGVPLVDAVSLLEEIYARGYGHTIMGKEYFLDHVHLSSDGYRQISLAIMEELIKLDIVAPISSWSESEINAVRDRVEKSIDTMKQGHAFRNLGKVLNWAGKFTEARDAFLKALTILGDVDSLLELASLNIRTGNKEEAIEYFRRALRVNPEHLMAHYKLGALLEEFGRHDEAIKHFKEVLHIDPDFVDAMIDLGVLLAEIGRIDESKGYFLAALQIRPQSEVVNFNLAMAFHVQGKKKEAIHYYLQAIECNPDSADAHYNLATLYESLKSYDESSFHFLKAQRIRKHMVSN